ERPLLCLLSRYQLSAYGLYREYDVNSLTLTFGYLPDPLEAFVHHTVQAQLTIERRQ
ncbi:hypothetical protein C0J52_12212, partial [Blattella germanica]